jgi:hypothetical protein
MRDKRAVNIKKPSTHMMEVNSFSVISLNLNGLTLQSTGTMSEGILKRHNKAICYL